MARETINPETIFNSVQYGFSQITTGQGRLVTISGQVGNDKDENIIGEGDFAVQFDQALKNVKLAMQAAGGTLDDILLLHIYMVQSAGNVNRDVSRILKQHFPYNLPAASWIRVAGLADPRFLVEVEVIAMI